MSWRDYLSPSVDDFEQRLRDSERRRPDPVSGKQLFEANAELRLAAPPYEPLATHRLDDVDPLQSFAETFAKLDDKLQERASVCVDLRAVPNARAHKIRRFWLNRVGGNVPPGTLAEPETHSFPIGEVVSRRQDTDRLSNKLNPQEVLFEVQILIHVESTNSDRATYLIRSFLTAFQQWKGANELTVYGQLFTIGGRDFRFFGTNAFRWRRWWFKQRLTTGFFWPAAPALLTARELAGLLKPWTRQNSSSAPIRRGGTGGPAPRARASDKEAV
jgi:hypothetical protein